LDVAIVSIVALAGLLGIGGIFCLFQAFVLIPTELGLAWFQAGVLLLCTCALVFSLDRMLEKVLQRLAAANPPSPDIARRDSPAMTAPVAALGPLLAAADAPDNDLQGHPLREAEEDGGLFGESRRVLRVEPGSMPAYAQDSRYEREAGQETVDDAMLRTIEQDLYARMPGLPESGNAASDVTLAVDAALPERPGAVGKTGSSPEPKPSLASPFGFSRFRLRNTPAPPSAEAEGDVMTAPDAASGEPEPAPPAHARPDCRC